MWWGGVEAGRRADFEALPIKIKPKSATWRAPGAGVHLCSGAPGSYLGPGYFKRGCARYPSKWGTLENAGNPGPRNPDADLSGPVLSGDAGSRAP